MPIHPSSANDVDRLIDDLASTDELQRETALARLAVIGARAVTKLLALSQDANAPASARLAALQALEAIADLRALVPALKLAEDAGEIGLAAIGVLGALARLNDPRATRAFDRLASIALDDAAREERRLAAVAALDGVSERVLEPIYRALAADRHPRLNARATRRAASAALPLDTLVDRSLPDDPAVLAAVVRDEGGSAKVTTLRRAVEAVRERERAASPARRADWTTVRGLAHQSLAARGSRLALYDLRETLEHARGPLPAGFLAAAAAIGDAACLEPLANAWVHSAATDRWWRDHLAEAFRAIVARERLSRRHQILRRILERWPSAGVLVAAGRK